jgi:pimeloyl-ACP methyl ester carboxylesterase
MSEVSETPSIGLAHGASPPHVLAMRQSAMRVGSRWLGRLARAGVVVACVGCDRAPAPPSPPPPAAIVDTGRIAIPNGSLYYEAAGAGSPVVLLHGGNLDRRMWDRELALLRQTHRVIRYDARGYGKSSAVDQPFAAHDDLAALLRGLGIPRASLVGLSLGGRIAMDFALAHPEMVDRLVLAAPGISGGTWAEDGDTLWLVAARAAAKRNDSVAVSLAWLESAYIRTALHPPEQAERLRAIVRDNASFWMGMIRHGDLEREASPPAAGRLEQLQMPILLLVGSLDTPFIQDVARAIAARAPHVRRVDIPGVGHMINLEAPDRFDAEVTAFLAGGT